MGDERPSSSAADEAGADGCNTTSSLEPGGGPQRVVSEQSADDIDDILDSLRATESMSIASTDTTAGRDETDDAVRTATAENDSEAFESGIGTESDVRSRSTTPDRTADTEDVDVSMDGLETNSRESNSSESDGIELFERLKRLFF